MPITLFFREIIKARLATSIKLVPLMLLFVCGCTNLPDNTLRVAKKSLVLHPTEGKWYYNELPFSGEAVVFYPNGLMAEIVRYKGGKKDGMSQKWFEDGSKQREATYCSNRLQGVVKSWWPNCVLSAKSYYSNGIRQGIQSKWYPNGQLSRQNRIVDGKEEGLQQAWRRNGKLYANYEAKNGRVFGLKRSNLCYALKDEIVQR